MKIGDLIAFLELHEELDGESEVLGFDHRSCRTSPLVVIQRNGNDVVLTFQEVRWLGSAPPAEQTCGAESGTRGVRCQLRTPHAGAHQWRDGDRFETWFQDHEADEIMRRVPEQ